MAPAVAQVISEYAQGDPATLSSVVGALSAGQLSGARPLPDPLPAPGQVRVLEALSSAEYRLLLIAALSEVHDIELLLNASAVGMDVLLSHSVCAALNIRAGRFHLDPGLRSAVISAADRPEQDEAHAALSRAARRRGNRLIGAWHAAQCRSGMTSENASLSLRLAGHQLSRGAVLPAHRIATRVASATHGQVEADAWSIAARAALWGGYLDEASRAAEAGIAAAPSTRLHDVLKVTRVLLEGPADAAEPRLRVVAHYAPLADQVTSRADRAVMDGMMRIAETWWTDPDEADAVQAQVSLTTTRAHRSGSEIVDGPAPSPLAEAHARLMQIAFQLQAGDLNGAAAVMQDAIPRLPLMIPGAGVITGLLRALSPALPVDEFIEAFAELGPRQTIAYEVEGPDTGQQTVAASRLHLPAAAISHAALTPRERDIAGLAARGLSSKAIGEGLGISGRTVEVHLTKIYRKTGVRTRFELVALLNRSP